MTLNGPLVMFYFLTLVMVMTLCFLDFTESNLKEGGQKGREGEESVSDSPPPIHFFGDLRQIAISFWTLICSSIKWESCYLFHRTFMLIMRSCI